MAQKIYHPVLDGILNKMAYLINRYYLYFLQFESDQLKLKKIARRIS